jgi:hypothetical protein
MAQGVTTAAIQGRLTQPDGSPIAGATVHVVNLSNGRRWEVVTHSAGGYVIEDAGVGGPYRIEARALGFAPEARGGIVLTLGQRLVADFELQPAAIELAPREVTATADPILNAGRTGPGEIISRARIAELPNHGRDFLALTTLSPHTAISVSSGAAPTGGITIAGQNRLYNSFQIDGGINHDVYRGRLPGRETLPRPISLEALDEIQILPAPFDVRHGAFAGGELNAVTRSGTNALSGSVFGYLADAFLVRRSLAGDVVGDFRTWQYGGNIGGPIVRDRAQYFLSVEMRHEVVPDPGPLITDTAGGADLARIGISYASATRFQTLLRDTFGLAPGTLGPVNGQVRATDVFGKLTVQLSTNSHLELSHHYAHGDRWDFVGRTPTFYFLSSSDQRDPSTVNASRLIWTGLVGHRWSNELIVSRLRLDDTCRPSASYGNLRAMADRGTLVAGAQGNCPTQPLNSVVQDVLEVTENLTRGFGAHILTFGTHGEALRFRDDGLQNASGQWSFATLDALQARTATRYVRSLRSPTSTGALDVRARQLGVYVQDRWIPTRGVTLTLGVRLDVPILPDAIATNDALRDSLGIDTGRLPSGNVLWSPRLGVNYDLRGEGRTFLRGGIGLFSGRPPYQWLGNAYRDNGAQELFLECRGAQAPGFDPVNQPVVCADGAGPVSRLSFFDPDMKFPQNLKLSLGADHRLPGGVIGSVDVLYTRAVHQLYLTDANLRLPVAFALGEANRPLYGTISGTATSYTVAPARLASSFGQVVRVSNRAGDHALSLSLQLRKQFGDRATASGFYSYTRARDRMSVVNPFARTNLENTPLNGTIESRPLRTSYFDIPHRVQLAATVRLPLSAWLSLMYAGASGTPYTHMVQGDVNADGIGDVPLLNDVMYVPRDRADISLDGNGIAAGVGTVAEQDSVYALIDALIRAEPCLRTQRGRILERNSCRNPWFGTVNARLTKVVPTRAGQSVELTADVYNVPNLLNSRWGQSRVTIPDPWVQTLRLGGYDASDGRGVYQYVFRGLERVQDLPSRWQVEVSVRYVF